MINRLRLFSFLLVLVLSAFLAGCGSGSGSIKEQVVTAENSSQLAQQARQDLSFQDYELMKGYVERVHPDVTEGQLPVGMTIATMIESQKAFLAAQGTPVEESDSAVPQGEADAGSTGRNVAAPTSRGSAPGKAPTSPADSDSTTAEAAPPAAAASPEPVKPPEPTTATLGSGTEIILRLSQSLSSKTNQAGQSFEGVTENDLSEGGHLIVPAGSQVVGKITQVAKSGKVKGKAQMSITLTQLVVGGETYPIGTNTLSFEAQGTGGRDAKRIGIATGIGAAVGAIAGGGKGAAIGAAIGGGAGAGVTLATSGDEVEFPNEQRLSFKLEKGVELPIVR